MQKLGNSQNDVRYEIVAATGVTSLAPKQVTKSLNSRIVCVPREDTVKMIDDYGSQEPLS